MSIGTLGRPDIRDVPVFIYGLTDRDGFVRYVGKSADPHVRFVAHQSCGASIAVRRWTEQLRASGERPGLVILHAVPAGEDADPHEARFIEMFLREGPLLNVQLPRRGSRKAWSFASKKLSAEQDVIDLRVRMFDAAEPHLFKLAEAGATDIQVVSVPPMKGESARVLITSNLSTKGHMVPLIGAA